MIDVSVKTKRYLKGAAYLIGAVLFLIIMGLLIAIAYIATPADERLAFFSTWALLNGLLMIAPVYSVYYQYVRKKLKGAENG